MFVEHKEAVEITEAPAKTLKLSEAIRIGIAMRPKQHIGDYYGPNASCALGAARDGFGVPDDRKMLEKAGLRDGHRLPSGTDLLEEIFYRNDGKYGREQQTREQIADWLESQGY